MIARLLLANALELLVGLGVATLLRAPLGTSYLLGLAVVGIVSAHLALVHVPIGWPGLAVLAAIALPFVYRVRPRLRVGTPAGWVGTAAFAALLVRAWPAFASKPLDDYDAWAIWGVKAKALALFGWADPSFFAAGVADPLQRAYPLLLPSLEAVAARTMGGFDPRLIHLQFLLLAVAGFAALHALLRDRVPWWLLWPALAALAAAPAFSGQLLTAYADVPLAVFVAAGLLAAARWLDDGAPRTLALATLFFAAAGLTKSEGILIRRRRVRRARACHAPTGAARRIGLRFRRTARALVDLARGASRSGGLNREPDLTRPRSSGYRSACLQGIARTRVFDARLAAARAAFPRSRACRRGRPGRRLCVGLGAGLAACPHWRVRDDQARVVELLRLLRRSCSRRARRRRGCADTAAGGRSA